jgi:N-acylglucosamine-6-phosphate 2-epimerase
MSRRLPAIVESLRHGLIVSCQAEGDDPFNRPEYVALFARAAAMGGACAIRACGADSVAAIKQAVSLPVIGLTKGEYPDGSVLITPDFADVAAVLDAGAAIVALDATTRRRPNGLSGRDFLAEVRTRWDVPIVADIATLAEGAAAAAAGATLVATTLAGYTGSGPGRAEEPDWTLLKALVARVDVPVVVEGRVWRPDQAARALESAAFAVVVGTAITRPRVITRRFVDALRAVRPALTGCSCQQRNASARSSPLTTPSP